MYSVVTHLPNVTFYKSKKKHSEGSSQPSDESNGIKASPLLVDFGRLLKGETKQSDQVVPGIPNTDLLHAVATLYGVSLSEVTDDIIYPTLCEKWSKTLLLLLGEGTARERLRRKRSSWQPLMRAKEGSEVKGQACGTLQERNKAMKESEEEDRFVNIFSDDESSEEEEEEDEDFMAGLDEFLRGVDERRERWRTVTSSSADPPVGIEARLIASVTFERSYQPGSEKVTQLTLVAVRRRFRGLGVGKYMVKKLYDVAITGGGDVIVTNADHSAVDFFEKQGFTDDVILNSKYAHIGDVWFNSKRMCYLPAYQRHPEDDDCAFDLRQMELELALWKERSLQAYQAHASIVQRMRREILTLRAHANIREGAISRMRRELDVRKDADMEADQDRMRERIGHLRSGIDGLNGGGSDDTSSSAHDVISSSSEHNECDITSGINDEVISDDANKTEGSPADRNDDVTSIQTFYDDITVASHSGKVDDAANNGAAMEKEGDVPTTAPHVDPPSDAEDTKAVKLSFREELKMLSLREMKHCFVTSMNAADQSFSDTSCHVINVLSVTPADLPLGISRRFEEAVTSSHDPDIVANLYYCGPSQVAVDDAAFDRILRQGFGASDFATSAFGRGLHFSRHAQCAARFSPDGQVIVAKVCLGRTQTVTSQEPGRRHAPSGFDSMLTQGRIMDTNTRHWSLGHSEYVVFKHDQAVPLALIRYQLLSK